jgi:hypothetical protein
MSRTRICLYVDLAGGGGGDGLRKKMRASQLMFSYAKARSLKDQELACMYRLKYCPSGYRNYLQGVIDPNNGGSMPNLWASQRFVCLRNH